MENNKEGNIKYIYSNRNPLLNFNSNKEKSREASIKNKLVKKSMIDQKSLDFINNNDIIKEAVAYSKLRKLKKNLAKKNINNSESFSNFSQKNEIIQNLEKIKQGYNSKNTGQIQFTQNELMNNSNSQSIIFNNNKEEINKNLSMSYAILPTLNLDKNRNYINREEKNLRIITDLINNCSTERINEEYNNVNTNNKKYIKSSIVNELLLRNKKRKKNEQNTINSNNSFLNVTVNQIRECPFFDKIKIPKDGHSRGIIEILKNFKQSKERKSQDTKSSEKNKNKNNEKDGENEKNSHNRKNVSKKKIKCLYDQKVFDEPKNRSHTMNRNFSYHKKILKNKKTKNNMDKDVKKTEANNNNINNENINIMHNKTISFNNIFEVKVPSLKKDDMINRNRNNRKKVEMLNSIYDVKDEFLYRNYINNKIKKKSTNDFYEGNNRHLINIKYNQARSQSNIQENYNNKNYNNYILNKSRSDSAESHIKNNNYILSSSLMGSPMSNNKMENYRNHYLNDNMDEDNIFYQTLPNLNHSVNRYESISKSIKIEEIKINMKKNKSREKFKNKDINFNKTNPYPYNRGKLNQLNSSTNRYKNVSSEQDKNSNFVSFNNNVNKHERYSSDMNNQKNRKMFKTNSSVNFKKNTMLYLKPKNKLKKGQNSFYYSSYNFFKNKNTSNDIKCVYTSPYEINESSPTSSPNFEFPLSKYNTNDENESENRNNNFNDINLSSSNNFNINSNRYTNINSNENDNSNNNKLKTISLSKLNNINSRIYKKPINKNILNNSKRNEDNADSNSLSYKEEYIFVNKTSKTHNNNKQLLYKENIDKNINSKNSYNNEFEIINDYDNDNDSIDESEIRMKIKIIKNGFINKYYNHCIKAPLQKNNNNNFTKKHLYKFKAKEKNKEVKSLTKKPQSSICYITKILITKNNLLIKNNDNNILRKKDNLKKVNKIIKEKDIKKLKQHKINKNNLNYDEPNINKNRNKLKNKKENVEKINLNSQKDNIKNEILYLLNILTSKNILSVENQLTKLIITSNNIFNIENNEYNAKLFLNDIINNENAFIEILINKIFSENKYITVYSKLCADLCHKYLNTINEVIINKCIDAKNKDNFNIIQSLKLKLKEECFDKLKQLINDINEENKQKIFYLIEFIYQSMENEIIDIKICLDILNILFNEHDKSPNNKYFILDIIIEFLFKMDKIDNFEDKAEFVKKVLDIINNIDNEENIPSSLLSKINKFKSNFSIKENKNIEDKKTKQFNFEGISLLMKEDMDNYFNYLKDNDIEFDSNENIDEEIEKDYNSNILKTIKKIDLDEIIKYYIDICTKIISNEEQTISNNSYIKIIIKSVSHKLSLNKMRTFHKNILQILADISHICEDNKYLYEIIGYLIYVLIICELCDIKDINIFINKDEESKIAISKIIRYTIASSGNCKKKYYEEFKNIDLFKNNDFFDKYITSELKDILNFN